MIGGDAKAVSVSLLKHKLLKSFTSLIRTWSFAAWELMQPREPIVELMEISRIAPRLVLCVPGGCCAVLQSRN